jgi:predicted dehydrogenase
VKGSVEDVAFITLTYPEDVIVGITTSWVSAKKVRTITLVGEQKMAVWDDLASSPVSIYRKGAVEEVYYDTFGEFQLLTRDGDVTVPRIPVEEPLQRQARFFLEAIRKGTASVCSGERGWQVVQTLEAITRSIRGGGTPVMVEQTHPA